MHAEIREVRFQSSNLTDEVGYILGYAMFLKHGMRVHIS